MRPLVAVRPPEYWPRPLFVALMDAADRVVLADTFPYSRQSRQNRTLVRTPSGGQWLSVPLAAGRQGRSIREIEIRGPFRWIRKHWRAFAYNYRTTPFFEFYEPELAPLFEREWDCLGALTCASVEKVAELFGIETPLVRASEVEGAPSTARDIHLLAGGAFLSAADTVEADRRLTQVGAVVHLGELRYRQNFEGFFPEMSALDLLFNYGPEALPMIRSKTYTDTGR